MSISTSIPFKILEFIQLNRILDKCKNETEKDQICSSRIFSNEKNKTKQNKRNGLKMWITKWGGFNLVWFQYHNYTQWKHHVSVERFWSKTEMEHENLVIW